MGGQGQGLTGIVSVVVHCGLHGESVLLLEQGQVARGVVLGVGLEHGLRHASTAVVLVAGDLTHEASKRL